MLSRLFTTTLFISFTILLQACASSVPVTTAIQPTTAPTQQATISAGKTLVIGEIASSPSIIIPKFQPLADYLAAHLSAQGYSAGSVKVAPDFETMQQWLKNGEVDLIFDSPYPAMLLIDQGHVKPILRRWKGGVSDYYTVIFARQDAKITSINDLKGKMLAFEEPSSTSGYMLPKAFLVAAGLRTIEAATPDAAVNNDVVGYVFVRPDDDVDIIQWVLSGKTPAGAVNSKTFDDFSSESKKFLVVLGKTPSVARHIVMVRGDLDVVVVNAITAVLLKTDSTPEGQAVLKTFEKTSKFDEFPEGTTAALNQMRDMYKLTQQNNVPKN